MSHPIRWVSSGIFPLRNNVKTMMLGMAVTIESLYIQKQHQDLKKRSHGISVLLVRF